MRIFNCTVALLLALGILAYAHMACAQETFTGIGTHGEGGPYAFTESGEFFQGSLSGSELGWSHRGNIFVSAGFERQAPIVGLGSHYWIGTQTFAVDEVGNVFALETTHYTWSHSGTLADLTGHEPAGVFMGVASFESGISLVAITDTGDAYMHRYNSEWIYAGNVYESSGVVGAGDVSAGSLKKLFR